jgi:DNA modification methylase
MKLDTVTCGDAVEVLRGMDAGSINMCVTSPPYYGLRDYGTAVWEGGDPECDHNPQKADGGDRSNRTLPLGRGGVYKDICLKCGALRKDEQIGLEETPDAYIAKLVDVFREVKRVMADDGTLWLNIGDSYYNYRPGGTSQPKQTLAKNNGAVVDESDKRNKKFEGIKEKDLIGIPWMLAFALRADGWYLRSDIIWHKPNPMPESVKDRPTKAHEYLFLLSKSQKYYYDADAIREPYEGLGKPRAFAKKGNDDRNDTGRIYEANDNGGRNKRSVWTVNTNPYKDAHFAVFPPDLIKPCILAGSRFGGVVLDPFFGSGTTGFVARELGRSFVGIDVNPEYCALARKRIAAANVPLFEA